MNYKEFSRLVQSDLYRYQGKLGLKAFWRNYIVEPGFRYSYYMRLVRYLQGKKLLLPFYIFAMLRLRHYRFYYGINIPPRAQVAPGLFIGHYGGIIVNHDAVIGKNCNISHNVTLGQTNRGERAGSPIIGDNVFIGPNVQIIGKIKIGNNAAIGAGAVVTKDIPDNAVAVGNPAKVISMQGSEGYINRKWED
jgi:serine O-acetyltransferase